MQGMQTTESGEHMKPMFELAGRIVLGFVSAILLLVFGIVLWIFVRTL